MYILHIICIILYIRLIGSLELPERPQLATCRIQRSFQLPNTPKTIIYSVPKISNSKDAVNVTPVTEYTFTNTFTHNTGHSIQVIARRV